MPTVVEVDFEGHKLVNTTNEPKKQNEKEIEVSLLQKMSILKDIQFYPEFLSQKYPYHILD